jgi:hypothetical protein
MERHTLPSGPNTKLNRSCRVAATGLLTVLSAFFVVAKPAAAQDAKTPQHADESVRLSMRNVKYRFAENVSVQINYLNGALVPVGDHEFTVIEDKESAESIRVCAAGIAAFGTFGEHHGKGTPQDQRAAQG